MEVLVFLVGVEVILILLVVADVGRNDVVLSIKVVIVPFGVVYTNVVEVSIATNLRFTIESSVLTKFYI